MIDFSDFEVNHFRGYGGNNGNKLALIINGENYMVKFPPKAKNNENMNYSNSCVNEYIGCHIFDCLGIKAQETILGLYNNKVVVACKDLNANNNKLMEFALLKNQNIIETVSGYGTELSEIIKTIEIQRIINKSILLEFFWDMFIVDALIGNFDRHNGNWGLLINEKNKSADISPIYDCGSSLFPQIDSYTLNAVLDNPKEIDKRVFVFPNSAIKINNNKINYFNFLLETDNINCLKSLNKIHSRIDLKEIYKTIDSTECLSNSYKSFYKIIIKARKEKILEYCLNNNKTIYKHRKEIGI